MPILIATAGSPRRIDLLWCFPFSFSNGDIAMSSRIILAAVVLAISIAASASRRALSFGRFGSGLL